MPTAAAALEAPKTRKTERTLDSEARALRVVHHKNAAKVAAHAYIIHWHAKRLVKLQAKIVEEARAIAGDDYKEHHDVGYDVYGSMESQRRVDDGQIIGTGFSDVVEMAREVAVYATRVAAYAVPPPLPSE